MTSEDTNAQLEIAPPDRDGRRCVCEWLEITREGERHVFEYFREHMPAPEAAGAHVSEVRSNPGNENGAWCEICCATLVCPSCGNHRSEPAAPPSDAVTRALDAFNGNDPMAYGETKRMTAALRAFAEALLDESDKTCQARKCEACERSLVNRVLTKAISNLLPEVKP